MRRIAATASLVALMSFGMMGCAGPGGDAGAGGTQEAPTQQDAKGGALEAAADADDQGGEARARQLMEGLLVGHLENVTTDATLEFTASLDGDTETRSTHNRALVDTRKAEPCAFLESTSASPSASTRSSIWIDGNEMTIDNDGQVARTSSKGSPFAEIMESPGGSDQARAIYEAAEELLWSSEGPLEMVRVVSDPKALTEAGTFPQLPTVESCEAKYLFDDQGRLVRCVLLVKGPSPDTLGVQMTMRSDTGYSDYGTTVVPSYPDRG